MAKEQQLFGYTKEQVNQLQAYLLDKPAKEAIPLLNIIGAGVGVTVTVQDSPVEPEQPIEAPKLKKSRGGAKDKTNE